MESRIVDLGSQHVWVDLNRSKRAKHVSIMVGRRGVRVTLPEAVSDEKAYEFLRKKESWILKKVRYFSKFRELRRNPSNILLFGQEYETDVRRGNKSKVFLTNNRAVVELERNTKKELKKTLEKWYKTRAKRLIPRIVREKNSRGHKINRVSIRNQRTRWASCAKNGNLNFNLKLAMAPKDIIEYIVIHELAHFEEMNHSKRFWALVSKDCPDYKEKIKWLRVYGPSLEI